jgi:tetratricopeptide (TPR) repeat protein
MVGLSEQELPMRPVQNKHLATVFLLALPACRTSAPSAAAVLIDDLAAYHRPVTCSSVEAQRFFDQGLVLYWGFDHAEADRSFARAAALDPDCAMAYWGLALSAGPHINNPTMDEEASRRAHENVSRALELLPKASLVEQALITALAKRYAWPPPADRRELDVAYAEAMRAVYRSFPHDPDVSTLYAESLMDLRPWDLWTKEGKAQPGTPEILEVLQLTMAEHPLHPGANHLAIHGWEMSPTPQRALGAANRLRDLVPGASHLVHMPAHIDLRLGRYDDAIRANQKAIDVANARVARSGGGGMFAMYRAHNYHFLVYAAQFEGRHELADATARELVEALPPEIVDELPQFVEGFLATPYHVWVRFGRWQEILDAPEPGPGLPGTRAHHHYARALALSALGRLAEAEKERTAFERAFLDVPEDYSIGNNSTRTVLAIGRSMLAGELAYRSGDLDAAFAHLREAVRADEALRYDEPWGWFQPAAHALGALLAEQGRFAEAEAVYRRDLELHPENGWALRGLEECLRQTGRAAEADEVLARFEKSWARADVEIRWSCYCRTEPAS